VFTDLPPRRSALEAALGYQFIRPELLDEALTHRSTGHGAGTRHRRSTSAGPSYERLEFLGDRVVGLVVAEMLLTAYPTEAEGALTRRFASLVRKETLAEIASAFDLADHIRLPAGESPAARRNPNLLADVCEAIIAALYLDGGMEAARSFVERHWTRRMEASIAPPQDAKTALQEWAQGRGRPLPSYRLVKEEGPPHQPVFTVSVSVEGEASAEASGASKRLAETAAARNLLDALRQGGPS
jgi:ribonuclease-3